jgi:hypothetical protein
MIKHNIYLALFMVTIVFPACSKKSSSSTNPTVTTTDSATIATGSILYTVQVLSGSDLGTAKTTQNGLGGAVVTTNQNGTIHNDTTDASGLATFSLDSGVIAVTVSANGFTSLNYLAQLGGSGHYNATMALLFPLNGAGTATISGNVFATLNQTSTSTVQFAPDGTGINAYIDVSNPINFVNVTSGEGTILKVAYQNAAFRTTVSGGSYTLTVPALVNGLPMIVQGDDFTYNVQVTATTFTRQVFSGASYSVSCKSGRNIVQDIHY